MFHIAVCDDVRKDAELLSGCVDRYASEKQQEIRIHYFPSGEELLKTVQWGDIVFSVIFLDIMMTGCDGIEAGREIRKLDKKVPIIYLTASRDFAVESYEVEAAGYLVKPFPEEKVERYLDKFLREQKEKRLAVQVRGVWQYLAFDEIKYLESFGHSVVLQLRNEMITVKGKLSDFENKLYDKRFLRCHQSYLVNMDYIHKVEEDFILTDGSHIPIRVKEKRKIAGHYYKYFVDKSLNY